MKVLLIRHAESEANAGMPTSDPVTISITEKGHLQATKLANEFNDKPDLIIVSAYLRTRQTAVPLIRKFPCAKVETWSLQEFTYLSPSRCMNTTPLERLPLVKEYWERCDPDFIHGTGAESFNQFSNRVAECTHRLKQLDNPNAAIFTHSQVMRLVKQCLEVGDQPALIAMKYFRDQMLKWPIFNTGILEFNLSK